MKDHQYTLGDLPEIAQRLLKTYGNNRVFALVGDLGAGKTTLVSQLCLALGVDEPTSSPTYSIVNEYRGEDGPVFHLDCYRLDSVEEALDAGLEEIFGEEQTVFVEWPEVIEPLLPDDVVFLRLSHTEGGQARVLSISTGH